MVEAAKLAVPAAQARSRGLGATDRGDPWWVGPVVTGLVLGFFVVYATFRALVNRDFHVGPYLSPFYSPNIEEWFGEGTRFAISPAIFILWMPGLFRLTCYYYRKAYYRAYFLDPPACGVGEARHGYQGETRLLLWQNAHRYTLYLAVFINVWLWIDVARAFFYEGRLGMGVGTWVLFVNSALLTFYTLSCHSLRHLVGGCSDCFRNNVRYKLWRASSLLNARHMFWAWTSLCWVMFADFYVWMAASGRIHDFNTWGELALKR